MLIWKAGNEITDRFAGTPLEQREYGALRIDAVKNPGAARHFCRAIEDFAATGFHALRRHCNGLGIVHGGMLASFLDGLLGHAVGAAAKRPGVTIHLSLDYLSMARAGDWIEGEARLTRLTREVAFAEARAYVGRRDVVRAAGVFKLMERKGR